MITRSPLSSVVSVNLMGFGAGCDRPSWFVVCHFALICAILYLRMDIITGNVGWIEVICGPMFSGKSEELIRRLRRATFARKRVQVFKPAIDVRYSRDEIVSHGDLRMKSEALDSAAE